MSEKGRQQSIWLYGWKSICCACDIISVSTMRSIVVKYRIPVKDINGKPAITRRQLELFLEKQPNKEVST